MKRTFTQFLCAVLALACLFGVISPARAAAWDESKLNVFWNDVPVYDGTPKEPHPGVAYGGKLLTEGTDYTVSYSGNIHSGNSAQARITGKGSYAGLSAESRFVIQPADISQCTAQFAPAPYIGCPVQSPAYSVRNEQGQLLTEGTDYVLIFSNHSYAGEGNVRIVGIGNYTGYLDATYAIDYTDKEIMRGDFYLDMSADNFLNGSEFFLEEGSRLILVNEGSPTISRLVIDGVADDNFDPDVAELYYDSLKAGMHQISYAYRSEGKEQDVHFTVYIVRNVPVEAEKLTIHSPIRQGSRVFYLSASGKDPTACVGAVSWTSADPEIAEIQDGIATARTEGDMMIDAEAGTASTTWGTYLDPIDISSQGRILSYYPQTNTALITWENEILKENEDYLLSTMEMGEATIVIVEGTNLFTGFISTFIYPVNCAHAYTSEWDLSCDLCGTPRQIASAEIHTLPHKRVYAQNEPLDPTGGQVTIHYDDGTSCTADMTKDLIQGNTQTAGISTVQVQLGTGESAVAIGSFQIEVTPSAGKEVTRIAGGDRYQTSFKSADQLKAVLGVSKFQNIVVASGTDFPDALAGSYLAAQKDAPILLVRAKNVNDVKDYIKKNLVSGGTVYLLGGKNAVPTAMETGLDGFSVKRLGGATRYDTNLLILKEAGVGDKDIIVCTGLNFADSLSASAVGLPILLVKDGLYASQKEFLKSISGDFIIVGGTNAVNATVEKQLKGYGTVKRLAGNTRYDTSVLVAKEFFNAPTSAVLAYAQNFPDGLCGGPLAYNLNAPLILTDNNKPTAAVSYVTSLGIKSGYILGGAGLISDKVVKNIFAMIADNAITIK